MAIDCTDPTGTIKQSSAMTGDAANATAFQQSCHNGEFMVGLWGQAGIQTNSIGPVCAPVSEVQAGTQVTFRLTRPMAARTAKTRPGSASVHQAWLSAS
ncbi:MAG TPA: hypothetical protein VJ860_17985 [Polyangia bacterium]|jgi:hypothetical protein|nr:hypothetical protein [Polyangia bacterium]